MDKEDDLVQHTRERILRFEQQIRRIGGRLDVDRRILNRLLQTQDTQTHKIRKIAFKAEQMNLFGT